MKITAENYDKIKQAIESYEIENNIPVVGRWGWFSTGNKFSYETLKRVCMHTGRFFDGVDWYQNFNYKRQ
jgi:hypothetical protein